MTELPLLVVDVQRGGPSTGLPTKTEQADLLQAMFGRNGESPVPIVAPRSPGDCFDAALEAIRIAVTYRTPVMLLSDGMLANGSEPWRIPEIEECHSVAGEAGMLLKVRTDTSKALETFICALWHIEGIERTVTMLTLDTYLDEGIRVA